MNKIRVSLDGEGFRDKPKDEAISKISNRIGTSTVGLRPISNDMKKFAHVVGCRGCTFCPATFKDGKRSKENFEQQQIFALDVDNKNQARRISLEEVRARDCLKTVKVTRQGYRQDRQQHGSKGLSSRIWWQSGGCFSV